MTVAALFQYYLKKKNCCMYVLHWICKLWRLDWNLISNPVHCQSYVPSWYSYCLHLNLSYVSSVYFFMCWTVGKNIDGIAWNMGMLLLSASHVDSSACGSLLASACFFVSRKLCGCVVILCMYLNWGWKTCTCETVILGHTGHLILPFCFKLYVKYSRHISLNFYWIVTC